MEIEPGTLAPAALLALAPPLLIAAALCRAAALLLALGALAYALFMIWSAVGVFLRTRRLGDLLTAGAIPCMHMSYGWGQWRELLHPDRDLSLPLRHGKPNASAP
ncbi:MAG: hypothetical protein LC725_02075 [Lentisphaerae bacterium]|nr:hypothetical protein [Lentisphaerota bacterium]